MFGNTFNISLCFTMSSGEAPNLSAAAARARSSSTSSGTTRPASFQRSIDQQQKAPSVSTVDPHARTSNTQSIGTTPAANPTSFQGLTRGDNN
ncbi:hypothetical protein HanRHA438_Chr11g0524341 [Helianthus annuus]|nr:hypothetical protein HanRHA438_Chr11g0524341 [Helianthus annuus]